jgi:hypothetical protein
MFIPFETLSPSSRMWIYQSDKELSKEGVALAESFLRDYCDQWAAHGNPLKASFDIRYNRFIIMGVDETQNSASGCSIDDSVRAVKHISQKTGLDFFNREVIAFKKGDHIVTINLKDLKDAFSKGLWDETTLVFNNMIATKADLDTKWIVPAATTWLKRYLSTNTIKV